MAELLRHRLQRATYGAGYSGPPMALEAAGLLRWRFWVRLLQQWGSPLTLLGGDPAVEVLGAGAERRGLALALLGGSLVAAGLDAGVEGQGSSGSGAQCWR
jgi:hypothetical protein